MYKEARKKINQNNCDQCLLTFVFILLFYLTDNKKLIKT